MPGPVPYTDVGGGGDNPPHGEDFFDRIVNVHWPEEGPVFKGGVFVAGDFDSNIYYMKFGLGAPVDDTTGDPIWQSLGTLDFTLDDGMFNGYAQGSVYGLVKGTTPTFVLAGGGQGSTNGRGIIMASSDGLNWSRVFSFGESSDTFTGANIFGVVWDGSAFWAGGHQSDAGQIPAEDFPINWQSETDVLFYSSDGFSWSEANRTELRIEWTTGSQPPWPEYNAGLMESHCSAVVSDDNGNGVPGGVFGYDEDTKTLIAPTALPAITYLSGAVVVGDGGGVNVVKTETGAGGSFSSNPGLPVIGVATAGGAWMAAGGENNFEGGVGQAAILIPSSTEEHGIGWKRLDPGGKRIITICGGVVPPPP